MSDFDQYSNRYENLRMERTPNGILTVTMHTNGGSHIHTGKAHREFPEAFGEIARDRENEVVIFTGAGEEWISHIDFSTVGDITKPVGWYAILTEARQLLYNFLDISVPVISAVNGPAPIHGEYALMADIILAAEDAYFQDNQHLSVGGGVVQWIERAKPLIQEPENVQVLTGLETWFELPRRPQKSPPRRYKMALLTWLAVFLTLSTARYFLSPLLAPVPELLAQIITIGIVVWILTYIVMPQLTRLFYKWLYPTP